MGRNIVIFKTLTLVIIQYVIIKNKKVKIKYFNTFLLIFSSVALFSKHTPNKNEHFSINTKYNNLDRNHKENQESNKPIILMIADEYSSPDNLYTLVKDSTLYDFSIALKKNGFLIIVLKV